MIGSLRWPGPPRSPALLVVAGEASGDAMAAGVVRHLPCPSFGLGGPALRRAGVELLQGIDETAVMGVSAVVRGAPRIAEAAARVVWAAQKRRPRAALLVGYSEFNGRLGPLLRAQGIRVLWLAPPQIWAWRPQRAHRFAAACDRMAVLLPFEAELWRSFGVDAHYVGHPALEAPPATRASTRVRLDLTPTAPHIAVLPGSRRQEVRRHLDVMLRAVRLLRSERGAMEARLLLAPTIGAQLAAEAAEQARRGGVGVLREPVQAVLPAFDVALAASGTVTLECALSGVPPVVVYRTDPLTGWVAKRWTNLRSIGLPNIVLGEPTFPELLQDQLTAPRLARAADQVLEAERYRSACTLVRERLEAPLREDGLSMTPSARVATLMEAWLS